MRSADRNDWSPELRRQIASHLERLRDCKTVEAVNTLVRQIADEVVEIERQCPMGAADIRNLAAYRRISIQQGWG
mgnify:CR=1 FL=1